MNFAFLAGARHLPAKWRRTAGALVLLSALGCAKSSETSSEPGAEPAPSDPCATVTTGLTPASDANAPAANANAATPTTLLAPIAWPHIGFVNNPGGNDPKTVALSFDDGPDGTDAAGNSNTSALLDQLDALKLKATFFVCGNLFTDVLKDPAAQAHVKRIIASGHHIGSHTYNHQAFDPASMTVAQAQNEILQNEAVYQSPALFGPSFHFTMWRSPFGRPFQNGIKFPPTASSIVSDISPLAPASPPNAVFVGWGIDSEDWKCVESPKTDKDPACITATLEHYLKAGASGVILMHSVNSLTPKALPAIVKTIQDHNYKIVMVEDYIKAKYGGTSADIARANATKTFTPAELTDAALAATKTSKWYLNTNE